MDLRELHDFIVTAKAATYVVDGKPVSSCRINSHDLSYSEGEYHYLDS